MTMNALETLRNRASLAELDEARQRLEEQSAVQRYAVATGIALTSGLSIGYVLWLVRSGLLLSSVLSALPAWQVLDPLPVLSNFNAREDEIGDDDQTERLFERRRTERSAASRHAPA